MMNDPTYYFAYGSNLSKNQMISRCPGSKYMMPGKLIDYSWFIYSRGYANIKPSSGDYVLGEIFLLTEEDENKLDCYEKVQDGYYYKETLIIQTTDGEYNCLVYIDSDQKTGKPKEEYINRINLGLVSSNLPEDYIEKYIRPYVPKS